jgi:hypothetical protein
MAIALCCCGSVVAAVGEFFAAEGWYSFFTLEAMETNAQQHNTLSS